MSRVALKLIPKSVTIFLNSVLRSDPPSCWAPAGISDGLTKMLSKFCKPCWANFVLPK
jgi:hypothetical protein